MKAFPIAAAPWGGTYRPLAFAALYQQGNALIFVLFCREREPDACFREPNSPVYLDSCLEVFLRPYPGRKEYLNFEMNANGALLLQLGSAGPGRRFLFPGEFPDCYPFVAPFRAENYWGVKLTVLRMFFDKACGGEENVDPALMYGNFYKCGERPPHFLCYAPVDSPWPDFHRPDSFVTLENLWNPFGLPDDISFHKFCETHLEISGAVAEANG